MAYVLKIALEHIQPPIWRRVRVPGSITFEELHRVIQAAFGWQSYHLYNFECGNVVVTEEEPDFSYAEVYGPKVECRDPLTTQINALFDSHDTCRYVYDFGDNWRHEIVVEKRLKDGKRYSTPLCLDGARSRPPEDVGGVGGYADFLETIGGQAKRKAKEYLEWAEKDTGGRRFDPEYFYANEVNAVVAHVLEDTPDAAHRLLATKKGLRGTLRLGLPGPWVVAGDQAYSWERLGRLLSQFEDEDPITITVAPGGRRR